jgi:hypothetical protein
MVREVTFNLFPSQRELITSKENVILLLASRGYGKSYSAAFYAIAKILQNNYRGIVANATYSQLRETTKYILQHLDYLGIEYVINCKPTWCKSFLSDHKNIISVNVGDGKHRYIRLISSDNVESIRGASADFLVLDEAAIMSENFFDTALPVLRGHPDGPEHNYQIVMCTTPTSTSSWLYKRFIENPIPSFKEIKALAQENIIEFTDEKIEMMRDTMTTIMFKREMMCEWLSLNFDTMAYAFGDHHIVEHDDKYKLGSKLFISCDINNKNLQSICGWYKKDFLYLENGINIEMGGNAIRVANEFHKLYSTQPVKTVTVTGDRYGSNKTTATGGKLTYYQQLIGELKRLGWTVVDETLNSNPSIYDSNEAFNRLLEQNKFAINSKCKEVIRHLKEVEWIKGEWKMNKRVLDSGFYDSIRYACHQWFPIVKSTAKIMWR